MSTGRCTEMDTKRKTRAQLRGKPLDEDCRKIARSDSGQYGPQDRRCYCTGIWDPMHEEILSKCRECRAWNNNAEPPGKTEGKNNSEQ